MIYAFSVPLIFGWLLHRNRHKMEHLSVSRKYGFLYGGFAKNRIWWEAVIMVRKLLFLLAATFLNHEDTSFKAGVSMVILVVFMNFHVMMRPYDAEFAIVGLMEGLSMLTTFFTYASVLLLGPEESPEMSGSGEAEAEKECVDFGCALDRLSTRDTFLILFTVSTNMLFLVAVMYLVVHDILKNNIEK